MRRWTMPLVAGSSFIASLVIASLVIGSLVIASLVIIGGLSASWLFAFQPEQVQLRFQFQPKQILTYEATDRGEGTMTFNFGGQDVVSQMRMEIKTTDTYQVERVSDYGDAVILRTTRGKMTLKVTTPTGEEKTETRDLPPTRVRMQVDPTGQVRQMQWLERPEREKEGAPVPLGKLDIRFSEIPEVGLENLLLPEKPVKVGDTWDIAQSVKMTVGERPVKLEMKSRGRFVGWEKVGDRLCAVLETTTEIPTMSDFFQQLLTVLPPEAGSATMDGSVKSEDKFWFDPDAGRILRTEGTGEFTMNLSFALPTGQSLSTMMLMHMTNQKQLVKVGTASSSEKP
jgi:hypothetical protein